MAIRVLALVATLVAGCTLPRAVIPGSGPGLDAGTGEIDAGRVTDAGPPPMDTALTPDDASVTPTDAWTPPPVDAWTPPGPRACDAIYGSADGYSLCTDAPTQCVFVATLYYIYNCNDVCSDHGGTCISQHFNGGSDGCTLGGNDGCGARGAWDEACVCTHPP